MKQIHVYLVDDDDRDRIITVPVVDAFLFNGSLKSCPEWVHDLVEDEKATMWQRKGGKKAIMISFINGYICAEEGDVVIKHSDKYYQLIRKG